MSSDIIIIDDKPASAQAANLFEMGRANSKTRAPERRPLRVITRRTDRAES